MISCLLDFVLLCLELVVHGVRAVPAGPVQRLRLLRPQRLQEAVPLRRGGGRGQPLLRSVRLQAQRSGQHLQFEE
jgi:hypothetical protein